MVLGSISAMLGPSMTAKWGVRPRWSHSGPE